MSPRKFFTGRAIGLIVLLAVVAAYFIYNEYFSTPTVENEITQEEDIPTNNEPVIFSWRFEEADTLNLDGNPNTDIYLIATYSDENIQEKLIGTTAGSCNETPDMAEDIALNSTMIQCYAAGLGYYFKVTQAKDSYQVERKTFEEAAPDYEPPVYMYEIVANFPL